MTLRKFSHFTLRSLTWLIGMSTNKASTRSFSLLTLITAGRKVGIVRTITPTEQQKRINMKLFFSVVLTVSSLLKYSEDCQRAVKNSLYRF